MSLSNHSKLVLVGLLTVSGCESDTVDLADYLPSLMTESKVTGVYIESKQNATLEVHQGLATLRTPVGEMQKATSIKGSKITLLMDDTSSLVSRQNLELIVSSDGQMLTCTACAGLGLGAYWHRVPQE